MTAATPDWLAQGDAPLPFTLTVCGGDADTLRRIVAMPQARAPDGWRRPRAGCSIAEFDARPVDALAWLRAMRECIADADVCLQPSDQVEKRLLICDMDMTIVDAETLDEVAALLGLGERIAAITLRAMRGELDFDTALRERIALLAGQPQRVFAEVAQTLCFSPGAETLVGRARQAGLRTILISGGFEQVARVVAQRAGFDEVYCNRLEIEAERLTGKVIEPIVNARFKRDKLIERAAALGIPLAACCAIGDGANDLPMLQTAGLGIAYHGKPILREAASCRIDVTDLASALDFMGIG